MIQPPPLTPALPSRPGRGFALPVVLLTLAAVGAIATGVIPKGTASVGDAAAFERRAREDLLIEAGLARSVLALLVPNDPMTEALRREEFVAWTFAGRDLTLAVRAESAKLDLNAADPGALAQALEGALGPALGPDATSAALALRGRLTTLDQILPLASRVSSPGARLREVVTVYGGQVGDRTIETASADGSPASVSERPIYTVQARLTGRPRARALTVLIDPERHRYTVIDRAELGVDDADAGQ